MHRVRESSVHPLSSYLLRAFCTAPRFPFSLPLSVAACVSLGSTCLQCVSEIALGIPIVPSSSHASFPWTFYHPISKLLTVSFPLRSPEHTATACVLPVVHGFKCWELLPLSPPFPPSFPERLFTHASVFGV